MQVCYSENSSIILDMQAWSDDRRAEVTGMWCGGSVASGVGMSIRRVGWRTALLFAVLLVGVGTSTALGAVYKQANRSASSQALPYPEALRPQVEFWVNIFGTYSKYQVVVHDSVYLDKVYAVLDFRPLLKDHEEAAVARLKAKQTKQEVKKIRAALLKLHKHGAKGRALIGREKKIWKLFRDVKDRHKFRKAAAKGRLRTQTGLYERFREGVEISGRYLPEMERIFRQEGLPVEITRLPLVESCFNIDAYSSARAAGIWQFIPSTGRLFLKINHMVDERRDPFIATRAAARLLKANYGKLETWPLAITAYNHGSAGMGRAVRKVGTRDITKIIRHYKSRSFGFASRNFYAELLAALEVEQNAQKYFDQLERQPVLTYDEVELKDFVTLKNLASCASTSPEQLIALNASFGEHIQKGKLFVPRGHRLRIPAGAGAQFQEQYAALDSQDKAKKQRSIFAFHKVRRGQTLGGIAQHYGTRIATLKRLNGLRSAHLIRIGQRLRVPINGKSGKPTPPRAESAQIATQQSGKITHTVRRGETLGGIAQRHNTTVASLKRINGIKNAQLVQAGKKLRISANSHAKAKPQTKYVNHKVRRGQTLGSIARRYGTTVSILKRLNGVTNVKRLQVGHVLRIPRG